MAADSAPGPPTSGLPGPSPKPPARLTRISRFRRLAPLHRIHHRHEHGWLLGIGYGLAIAGAELVTLLDVLAGLLLHLSLFVGMAAHGGFLAARWPRAGGLMLAMAPIPLIRVISVATPLTSFSYLQWFVILGVVVYAAIFATMHATRSRPADVGVRLPSWRAMPLEVAVVVVGPLLGYLEYQIIQPGRLIDSLEPSHLIAPAIILFLSTGLLEELLFRGLVQKHAIELLGVPLGIGLVTFIFGILHVGFLSVTDVVFASLIGLLYSLVVLRTRTIIGVSISHGLSNMMLFLVMPLL